MQPNQYTGLGRIASASIRISIKFPVEMNSWSSLPKRASQVRSNMRYCRSRDQCRMAVRLLRCRRLYQSGYGKYMLYIHSILRIVQPAYCCVTPAVTPASTSQRPLLLRLKHGLLLWLQEPGYLLIKYSSSNRIKQSESVSLDAGTRAPHRGRYQPPCPSASTPASRSSKRGSSC